MIVLLLCKISILDSTERPVTLVSNPSSRKSTAKSCASHNFIHKLAVELWPGKAGEIHVLMLGLCWMWSGCIKSKAGGLQQ